MASIAADFAGCDGGNERIQLRNSTGTGRIGHAQNPLGTMQASPARFSELRFCEGELRSGGLASEEFPVKLPMSIAEGVAVSFGGSGANAQDASHADE